MLANRTFLVLFLFFATSPSFSNPQVLNHSNYFSNFIMNFQKDSYLAMNTIPPRFDTNGKLIRAPIPLDEYKEVIYSSHQKRSHIREKIIASSFYPASLAAGANNLARFFPSHATLIKKIEELQSLEKGSLEKQAWSGDYWPTYRGGIGSRYEDPNLPKGVDFKMFYDYFQNRPSIDFDNFEVVQNLSPSEKYDILMGDSNFTLTKWSFSDAYDSYVANGQNLETWFGLCHGWAPASFMLERPRKTFEIQIKEFQGKTFMLKFYPDDIKALASLLWANSTLQTYFLGGRCNIKQPDRDENGRIIDDNCFDVNPGSWHLAVINQLGKNRAGIVMDATFDYEVWNQPVVSYKFTYFNPETKKQTSNLKSALIPIKEFKSDKFKKYRASESKYIVGIIMELTYVSEARASHKEMNSEDDDDLVSVQYVYDLEVNSESEIIGGEWYQNVHPDFLWTPPVGARAISVTDHELVGEWASNTVPPVVWKKSVQMASSYGQPVAKILEGLIQRAQLTH